MKKALVAILGATALATSSAALADPTFNFGSNTGNLGTTETYTNGSLTVTATGYSAPNVTTDLYGKNFGGDEVGIGLAADPTGQNEIYGPGTAFVQLDVSALLNQIGGLDFAMNSTTLGEEWAVFGSNTAGAGGGTQVNSGNTEGTFSLGGWGSYNFYNFYSLGTNGQTAGNVLLASATASVPEPATWGMMLIGFGAIGFSMRRRKVALAQIA
jgi:PEP-CTERM motif